MQEGRSLFTADDVGASYQTIISMCMVIIISIYCIALLWYSEFHCYYNTIQGRIQEFALWAALLLSPSLPSSLVRSKAVRKPLVAII